MLTNTEVYFLFKNPGCFQWKAMNLLRQGFCQINCDPSPVFFNQASFNDSRQGSIQYPSLSVHRLRKQLFENPEFQFVVGDSQIFNKKMATLSETN